ncbi:MAG: hypothetical protein KGM24_14535 [Elusimicrobia bacterium]|nr:hypothetical protein [Elusimicrobiota bacterium]
MGRKQNEIVLLAAFTFILAQTALAAQTPARILSCRDFPASITVDQLSKRFGKGVVVSTQVYAGEGYYEDAVVLFPDSAADRLELRWLNSITKTRFASVCAKVSATHWKGPKGITIGSSLKSVQKSNGRPFFLSGFGWDGEGGAGNWNGGALASPKGSSCHLALKFMPTMAQLNDRLYNKVLGDHRFSSGNHAMQHLNPKVTLLCLTYN